MGLSVFSTKEFGESCEESETGGEFRIQKFRNRKRSRCKEDKDPRGGCYGYCQSAFMEKSVC